MFTLVPASFFDPASARKALAEVADLKEGDAAEYVEIPQYGAVLVYATGGGALAVRPEIYEILMRLPDCSEYNKILCSLVDGRLFLAIAQGRNLLLANSYPAADFTTAQYYLFLAMSSLQLNPEVSTICWRTPLDKAEELSLYRYFKSVVRLP